METLVGYLLLFGVVLSIILIAAGVAWYRLQTGRLTLEYQISDTNLFQFIGQDAQQLFTGAFSPQLLVNLGIATLILTPYSRVFVSVLYFGLAEHNVKYTLFTTFVFSVLTFSFFRY